MSSYEPVSSSIIDVTINRMKVPGRPSQVVWYLTGFKNNSTTGGTISWTLDRPFYLESIDSAHVSSSNSSIFDLMTSVGVSIVPPVGGEIILYQQYSLDAAHNFGVPSTSPISQVSEWKKQDFNLVLDTGTIFKATVYATPTGLVGQGVLFIVITGHYLTGGTMVNG